MTINELNNLSLEALNALSHEDLVLAVQTYQQKFNNPDSIKNKIQAALTGGTHMSIKELAETCNTSPAVISSNLSYLKKAGVMIATDPLGKKFIWEAASLSVKILTFKARISRCGPSFILRIRGLADLLFQKNSRQNIGRTEGKKY